MYNGRKGIGSENPSYLCKAKDLRPALYDERVINLGFMNYLEEQMNGEAMINSIKNGDQPLPTVTQVSIAGATSSKQPPLKDKSMWSDQEKKIRKINRLARSLVIQGLQNDIYSLIDSNKIAKDLCDALERHMLGSEYGEQDRKAAVLYEYENFKTTEGELLLDIYIRYLQYAIMMRQNKNLLDINIDALYNILKQNQGDVNDAMKSKKKAVMITSDPLALVAEQTKSDVKKEEKKVDEKKRNMSKVKCYNCKKEGHFAKDCKKAKVKDYEYYKTKKLLAKKDKDEQVLLAKDHAWMESNSEASSSSSVDKIAEVKNNKLNEQIKVLIEKNDDLLAQTKALQEPLKVKHVVIDNHVECQAKYTKLEAERYEYMIRYSAYFDNDKQYRKQIADQEILFDKMSRQLVELDENVRMLKNTILEKDLKIYELKECARNKDLEIKKCLERLNDCENKLHKIEQTNQTIHMIMPYKDKFYKGRKGIGFENPSYFCKAKDLRPTLYDERVINFGYTLMFLTHSNEALEIEKFKRARENKIEFAYDYGNLNASYQTSSLKPYVPTVILEKIIIDLEDEVVSLLAKEKENLETIESLKLKGFESSEKVIYESENQSENDCQVVENVCDDLENPNVITSGMFKLSVSQSVSPISVTKMSCASNSVETKLKRKRSKRTSSKHNVNQRYSRKNLMACNNSYTRSEFACNNAMNGFCNSYDIDVNALFVFDDVSIRKYPVRKMTFRKKPSASLNVPYRSKSNKSLPRIVHKWLPKMKPLAEPITKWIPRVKRQIDKITMTSNSPRPIFKWVPKHMTGNRALLTNFMEKFIGTVFFENNDFAVIVGYADVVIGSMTIKRVYYVEELDLLTGDRSSILYTIALNEIASNSSSCLLGKASSLQSWLWHQRLSHLTFATINNLVKNNLVRGLPKVKFKKDHLFFACEQGKIHQKHHKSKMAFASNKPLYLLHMDLCGSMRVESINGKRYVLVVVDDFSRRVRIGSYGGYDPGGESYGLLNGRLRERFKADYRDTGSW
nr:hypothetical protein [Tanacetum cinerariifolium]